MEDKLGIAINKEKIRGRKGEREEEERKTKKRRGTSGGEIKFKKKEKTGRKRDTCRDRDRTK